MSQFIPNLQDRLLPLPEIQLWSPVNYERFRYFTLVWVCLFCLWVLQQTIKTCVKRNNLLKNGLKWKTHTNFAYKELDNSCSQDEVVSIMSMSMTCAWLSRLHAVKVWCDFFSYFFLKMILFRRFLHLCVPLCGEGKCEEAVEDLPVLRQNATSREFRLDISTFPFHN